MNRISKAILGVFVVVLMGGCAKEYESNMQARKEISWVQTTNQHMATQDVMAVISKILNPFEDQYRKDAQSKFDEVSDPLKITVWNQKWKPSSDNQFAMAMMSRMMMEMVAWNGRAELMWARTQAIHYLQPLIEAIYAQHLKDFGTPMSTNQVYTKLIDQIPFVTTVGGMYALGAKGISAAGDTVNADHSIVNTGGVQSAHGSTAAGGNYSDSDMSGGDMSITTNTATTTIPSE